MNKDFIENFQYDVVIVGQGIAGLSTAYYLPEYLRIAIISKSSVDISSTWMAQGGIAASISKFDSPEKHFEDTIKAGDGICDETVVNLVVNEGRERIVEMIRLGVPFERIDDEFDLAREGGHSIARILHFGDQTGEAIAKTLRKYLHEKDNIDFFENFFLTDLLFNDGVCCGIEGIFVDDDKRTRFISPYVVLATGGSCQLFEETTNPSVATGDGIAVAFRNGAVVADMEFIQFHPTVLKDERRPKLLITEAARGRGARILTPSGELLMEGYHELKDLAPRSVIVKRMAELIIEEGIDCFYLDMRHFSEEDFNHIRFVTSELKKRGYDPARDLIPVYPAAHYFIGGLKTDTYGRTSIPNLFACGEVASTGLHGANRLASNSLLEGLVFGKRIADSIRASDRRKHSINPEKVKPQKAKKDFKQPKEKVEKALKILKKKMWRNCGMIRSKDMLENALKFVEDYYECAVSQSSNDPFVQEFLNLITVARCTLKMAIERTESRGVHYRIDYPDKDDQNFKLRQKMDINRCK